MAQNRLTKLLEKKKFPTLAGDDRDKRHLDELQMRILRIQQGIWHQKSRAIILFEGFDAAGKGGAIRVLTEKLDPRGVRVHPTGPPTEEEKTQHYLQRFWRNLPEPGTLAIFDRSWYGRVMVERVDELIPPKRWKQAYGEINDFERALVQDGIDLVKIFLAIHPDEQLRRFEDRIKDPAKQWKLGEADLHAHTQWRSYVRAVDEMLDRTNTALAPWTVIPADSKSFARQSVLEVVSKSLGPHRQWMEQQMLDGKSRELNRQLAALKKASRKR